MAVTVDVSGGRFRYRAATADGAIARGRLSASDADDVIRQLAETGLLALEVEALDTPARFRRVRTRDLAIVFRSVSSLVSSGVPIERALAVSEELVPQSLAESLARVRRLVREGHSVAEAMETLPGVFPGTVVGVIHAGERGSTMAAACESVADQLEAEAELVAQVQASLAYPILILAMGLVTIAVMGGVVVPRFAAILVEMGAEIPRSTRALLWIGRGMSRLATPELVPVLAALAWLGRRSWNESAGRRKDDLLLRAPVIGKIRWGLATARTCAALGSMLSQGMSLLAALDAAGRATGDRAIAERLATARTAVARGSRLTEALDRERVLVPAAIQLVGVGESTAQLGPMFLRAGETARAQAHRSLRAAVSLLEPFLVISLGALIAFVAAGLLQAIYSVRPV